VSHWRCASSPFGFWVGHHVILLFTLPGSWDDRRLHHCQLLLLRLGLLNFFAWASLEPWSHFYFPSN
jgi:hypothetical protein